MIFFDTNVIVDCFVKRYNDGQENPRHNHAVKLWESVEDVKVISNLVRIEVINILYLKHKKDKELIAKVYISLLNDFEIIDDSGYYDLGLKKIIESDEKLSINDAIYLAIMEDYGIDKIASFDSSFDKRGIERIY